MYRKMRSTWIALLACLLCILSIQSTFAEKNAIGKLRIAAENAFANGDMKKAITLFSKLIEEEPANERNFYKRFRAYLSERKYGHALTDLDSAIAIAPTYKQALNQRGKIRMMLGDCDLAEQDFSSLLNLDSSDKTAHENLRKSSECSSLIQEAEAAQSKGDYQKAHDYLNNAIENFAFSSVSLQLERAQLSYASGNMFDAIAESGMVLKLESSNIPALTLRGDAYYSIGDLQSITAALEHYRQGLLSDPENKGLKILYRKVKKILKFTNNANSEMESASYEEASEDLESALDVDPSHNALNKDLWLKLCDCKNHMADYTAAEKACKNALKIDEGFAEAHSKYGDVLINKESYEDAVREHKRAVELDGNNDKFKEGLQRAEVALKQSKNKDYYKILGVARDATNSVIKRAYRKKALLYHPDKHADKEDDEKTEVNRKFQEVTEAYEILSDEESRAKYDRGEDVTGNEQSQQPQQHPFNPFGGGFFQQGGGFRQQGFYQQGGQTFHFKFG